MKFNPRSFLFGVLAAIVPTVGAAWAFATLAADHVLQPHLEGAKARIGVMCTLADVQNRKLKAICDRTQAACDTSMDEALVAACHEATK
jgi:hypothetical protein